MDSDPPLPREVKVIDAASLLGLEEQAHDLDLNQRLDPAWVRAHAAPDGAHYLWPALWNTAYHRPDLPRQLRCELLLSLRTGGYVMSLLDMLPDAFAPLPRVTSREEGMRVSGLLDRVPSVREWSLRAEERAGEEG
ncbi:hypothetical protein ACQEU5_21480 [Marinactinospora thermotolerans]|uniref:Uncharacterized protein n=1 Tax=Marinactinospora thermotolerans DSM 45154 TaxID=1122192 RepID=A0A1T4PD15_9ACTN|nr:hypothetical protein [Marinactinospora thermotolerans]SJZ89450.1 hypothetical protein SAMN02745673_01751 [Marinactinospora thermotolerans DSM 45154]